MFRIFRFAAVAATLVVMLGFASTASAADPLPSWNDGASKQAIVKFVESVTREGSPDFVPAPERIATFDNDGTLWAEQPIYFQVCSWPIASRRWRQTIRSGKPRNRSRRC